MNYKKSVAFFIRSFHKGGAEKQSILLTKNLSNYYNTYLVLFYPEGDFFELAHKSKINLILLKGNYFQKIYSLYKFLRKKNIYALFNFSPINNVIGTFIGKIADVKLMFGGLRGSMIKDSKIKMFFQKHLLNSYSTKIISNSYKAKETYSDYGFKNEKIIVIHNSIKSQKNIIIRKNTNFVKILSVGRFAEEKDYDTALNAIGYLLNNLQIQNKTLLYQIIGYGDLEEQIREKTKNLNISQYVQIRDGRKDVSTYYRKSDIYLITSTFEGMSNTVMEAMSFSLPVVATCAGDTSYLVKDGFTGFLCKIGDYKQIAERIKTLIVDFNLRKKMSLNAYNHIKDNFSIEKQIIKYKQLINQYCELN